MELKPKISVVTVCYNAASVLEQTILSVLNQTYNNIEYIVIDGGSTDLSIDIIRKYQDQISYWVSEPDKGIYDAMNKGIKRATGHWICFLNSGDIYTDELTLSKVAYELSHHNPDVLYGDLILKYQIGLFVSRPLSLETFQTCFPFSHPASFVKLDLMKEKLFDCKIRIVADYNFFYSLYKEGRFFHYMSLPIAVFEAEDGVSSQNVLRTFKEVALVNGSFHTMRWRISFLFMSLKHYIKKGILFVFPNTRKLLQRFALERRNGISEF